MSREPTPTDDFCFGCLFLIVVGFGFALVMALTGR